MLPAIFEVQAIHILLAAALYKYEINVHFELCLVQRQADRGLAAFFRQYVNPLPERIQAKSESLQIRVDIRILTVGFIIYFYSHYYYYYYYSLFHFLIYYPNNIYFTTLLILELIVLYFCTSATMMNPRVNSAKTNCIREKFHDFLNSIDEKKAKTIPKKNAVHYWRLKQFDVISVGGEKK